MKLEHRQIEDETDGQIMIMKCTDESQEKERYTETGWLAEGKGERVERKEGGKAVGENQLILW